MKVEILSFSKISNFVAFVARHVLILLNRASKFLAISFMFDRIIVHPALIRIQKFENIYTQNPTVLLEYELCKTIIYVPFHLVCDL